MPTYHFKEAIAMSVAEHTRAPDARLLSEERCSRRVPHRVLVGLQ